MFTIWTLRTSFFLKGQEHRKVSQLGKVRVIVLLRFNSMAEPGIQRSQFTRWLPTAEEAGLIRKKANTQKHLGIFV